MKHQQVASRTTHEVVPKKRVSSPTKRSVGALESPSHSVKLGREDMIRTKAYSFYEARDRTSGHELEDWLRAEAQVNQLVGN